MGNCASVGGWPLMKNESGCIDLGDTSRESIVVIRPVRPSRSVMNPPPPMPHEYGSTTPRTLAPAIAASNAFPPRRSTSIAACVASGSTDAAAPLAPTAAGCFSCAAATGALNNAATAPTATTHRIRRTGKPPVSCASPLPGASAGEAQHRGLDSVMTALSQAGDIDRVGGERGGGERVGDARLRPGPQLRLVTG